MSDLQFICFLCKKSIRSSSLRWHLNQIHNLQGNDVLICYQNGCMRTFSRFSSYRKHLFKCSLAGAIAPIAPLLSAVPLVGIQGELSESDVESDVDVPVGENVPEACDEKYDIRMHSASFIAKLRASNSMTLQNVDLVVESVSEMVSSIVAHLDKFVYKAIEASVDIDTASRLTSKLSEHFAQFKTPFSGLETQYQENKFFEGTGCLIMPEEKVLGHRMDQRNYPSTSSIQQVVVSDTTCYIPISKVLKQFLERPGVWQAIQSYSSENDTVLRDFHDGKYFKNHATLSARNCICLGLYNDDMETANPLGSHATVHKLGFLYYIVKNLPPKFNSVLSNCQLLQVYHSVDVKKYGFCRILEPFIEEIRKLEVDGMTICVDGVDIHITVTLGQVSGDNLGMHGLFGFVESFSGNYPCRFCTMHKNDMQTVFTEDNKLLRTRDTHDSHVQSCNLNNDGTSCFGVMGGSPLNQLNYYHVTDNYAPDIMHDMLEGVCGFELKLVLYQLIYCKKYFDLSLLNERIRAFNYSPIERGSKPTCISASHLKIGDGAIKQSASEMWCLVTNLPIIIGDQVPTDDPHWQLLLSLLDVMSLVFASAISEGATYYLQSLISDHMQMFVELFPNNRLRPKHHFLTHYPRCIRLVGPLIRFWCMRFEAKHNFFRRLSHIVCNFRNISKTMAMRHQMMQCYIIYSRKSIDSHALEVGPGSVVLLQDVADGKIIAGLLKNVAIDAHVFIAKWVSIHGVSYRSGMFLVVAVNGDGQPVFSRIKHILVVEGKSCFVLEQWRTVDFERHIYAFCVERDKSTITQVLNAHCLLDYYPLSIKQSYTPANQQQYLVMRSKPWY